MKIKRFEASNMAEALRMVKKEFGEDAVILSAKTLEKSPRLFGGQSGGQVVVTAAIDVNSPERDTAVTFTPSGQAAMAKANGERASEQKPPYGISRILQHFTPITRTGQKKLQPKVIRLMNEAQDEARLTATFPQERPVSERLREQGLSGVICDELVDQLNHLMPDADSSDMALLSNLSQIIEARGWVAPAVPNHRNESRIVVLAGPHGVGKTTTAAKLAAHSVLNAGDSVALLSLDDQRVAGTTELQRYAGIMGVHFESAGNPEQVRAALERMKEARLIVVDTPGLGPNDACGKANLSRLLDHLGDAEIHLLIHAGAQEQVMSGTIQHYKSLKIKRLLPTHVDWCRHFGPFINQLRRHHWPISYMGIGAQVPEGLRLLTSKHLAAMLLGLSVQTEAEEIRTPVTVVGRPTKNADAGRYVANRNSDIFHEASCKSVSRINNDNAIIFRDPSDALSQGFKPCRMCCIAHFAPKPIDRRENRHFAGSRN